MKIQSILKRSMVAILFLALTPFYGMAQSLVSVAPTDPNILIQGSKFAVNDALGVEFLRMPEEILSIPVGQLQAFGTRARTTSGVRILFRTASPTINVNFKTIAGEVNKGSSFGVYVNGVWLQAFNFPNTQHEMTVSLTSAVAGESTYDIVLPSWSNPFLTGIDLVPGKPLVPLVVPQKKVYLALGDSITHGTGQSSAAYKTYAFLLSEKLGYELFNLASGGSKIAPRITALVNNWTKVDMITYLIGYNDWQGEKSVADYKKGLDEDVRTIRTSHPDAKIFLIRQTYTKTVVNGNGVTIEPYRNAVTEIVTARKAAGDANIFVVNGEEIITATTEKSLVDAVHLTPKGAQIFADGLYTRILPNL